MDTSKQLEKIAKLEATANQVANRLKDEKAKLRSLERKQDARRKIIIGATMLAHADEHPAFHDELWKILNAHVMRDADRIALGLKPRKPPANDSQASA